VKNYFTGSPKIFNTTWMQLNKVRWVSFVSKDLDNFLFMVIR